MGMWERYASRLSVSKAVDRAERMERTKDSIARGIAENASYKHVTIDGVDQDVTIVNTPEYEEKKIYALPGEKLTHGGLVHWKDSYWIICSLDANNDLYDRGRMKRCNYVLKWIDKFGNIISKWCIVEDGTKYLVGESPSDVMTIGSARIAVTIAKDDDTKRLTRGYRFLVGDEDSDDVLCYRISKPNNMYNIYNGVGVYRFIMTEDNVTDKDNLELRIADYYGDFNKWLNPTKDIKVDDKVDESYANIRNNAKKREGEKEERIEETGRWL